ncbi:MAG: hypothetical protein AABW82_01800 [Nanoarchaeota archaeon]
MDHVGINLGLNNQQVSHLERLMADRRQSYPNRLYELSSFLKTRLLLDEERHALKRFVNETAKAEYEFIRLTKGEHALDEWYNQATSAINELASQFDANKVKYHSYRHDMEMDKLGDNSINFPNQFRVVPASGKERKRYSLSSLVGFLLKPFYRKT